MTLMEHDAVRPDGRPIPEPFAGLPEDFARAQLRALENALHVHGKIDEATLDAVLATIGAAGPGDARRQTSRRHDRRRRACPTMSGVQPLRTP